MQLERQQSQAWTGLLLPGLRQLRQILLTLVAKGLCSVLTDQIYNFDQTGHDNDLRCQSDGEHNRTFFVTILIHLNHEGFMLNAQGKRHMAPFLLDSYSFWKDAQEQWRLSDIVSDAQLSKNYFKPSSSFHRRLLVGFEIKAVEDLFLLSPV